MEAGIPFESKLNEAKIDKARLAVSEHFGQGAD